MTDSTLPRLSGSIWKRNAGLLHAWHHRAAVVTTEGFFVYKKKVTATKTKTIDLIKTTFTTTIAQTRGYFYFELQCGSAQMAIGFPAIEDTRLWLSSMMEAADENSGGRRVWMANLRRMLTLKLQDRQDLIPDMAERDWFTEWNFCIRSLNDDREAIVSRQRRLRRLYTVWLQFEVFSEMLAEIVFSLDQQRDARGFAYIQPFEQAARTCALGGQELDSSQRLGTRQGKDGVFKSRFSKRDDVDEMKLAGIQLQSASKSWQGHKRLTKQMALFARFRSLIELFFSTNTVAVGEPPALLQAAFSKLFTFPLISAFSIQGVSVVAIAVPLQSERSTLMTIDSRDLTGLTSALRKAKMLQLFPYQELPTLVVRQLPGQMAPTLIELSSRYEDVLLSSLRSSMVHGVLIRATPKLGNKKSRLELLSAHDVQELVEAKKPKWIPYLNLMYYRLNTQDCIVENVAAKRFLFQSDSRTRHPLTGDIIITFSARDSKLPLDLPEAFVQKHKVDMHLLVQKLQELKKTSALVSFTTSSSMLSQSQREKCRPLDTSLQAACEYEDGVKHLFVQHMKEFAAQLVTLGDVAPSRLETTGQLKESTNGSSQGLRLVRSHTMASMPRPQDVFGSSLTSTTSHQSAVQPRLPERTSSLSTIALTHEATELIDKTLGTYVIDTLHLRHIMRESGVSIRFLPLVFQYLDHHKQRGVRVLVASEIVARVAKNLFRYRMHNEHMDRKSRWKSRKARLIQLVNAIMHGLFHKTLSCVSTKCGGDQFWEIDGPITYLLGAFASSFAMDPTLSSNVINSNVCFDEYRDLLKANPAILFNNLLYVFHARLSTSILPEVHEDRFVSIPFLRTESDLILDFEDQDSLRIHENLLWSHVYFFHVHYGIVKPGLPIVTQRGSKTGQMPWTHYYQTLSSNFRQSLGLSHLTRLDTAIQSWQDVTVVRAHISLALRAAVVSSHHSLKNQMTLSSVQEHCHFAYERMASSKTLFPIEYKFALQCLKLVGTGKELTEAIKSDSHELFEWLRLFYRPANPSQFANGSSSHPMYSILYSTEEKNDRTPGAHGSLKETFQHQQCQVLWRSVMPYINCRSIKTVRPDPVALAATNAVLCDIKTSSCNQLDDRIDSSWITEDPSSISKPQDVTIPSSRYSSRSEALWFVECFFLPPFTTKSLLVAGDTLEKSEANSSRLINARPRSVDHGPVPGLALMWGNPLGLSLEDEAQLNSQLPASTSLLHPRPDTAASVRCLAFPLPLQCVVQIACGYRHTALITDDRHLYTFGHGECGRLGHGSEESCLDPRLVLYFSHRIATKGLAAGVVDVSCGREHTMVVTANGELFGFGWGEAGRLGTGETGSILQPSHVKLTDITTVACGREHTLALTRDGKVFAFGAGFGGRLGTGTEMDEELPVFLQSLEANKVAAIDAGECHSCALSTNGKVFTWGFGHSGALGHGIRDSCLQPTLVNGPWTRHGQVVNDMRPEEAIAVTSIACGGYHTLVTTSNGMLYGWGDTAAGQLGPDHLTALDSVVLYPTVIGLPTRADIRTMSCGTFTSALCDTLGQLFVWGSPAAGNGAVASVDDASIRKVDVLQEFDIAQVACGAYHTVAITQKRAYC